MSVVVQADARRLPIASGVVQCVVTSPPYWGLRDYGTADQIGLERTPDAYVAGLVDVFRQVHRVLRDDGVLWLNLGDSYAGGGRGGGSEDCKQRTNVGSLIKAPKWSKAGGLKAKDLVGIPWRVAFALQTDGWYLRSDVIWSKPNPMPESVTDRPTKAHEYVFLLTKSAAYFYNDEAIREPYAESTIAEAAVEYEGLGLKDYAAAGVQNPSDTKRRIVESVKRRQKAGPQPVNTIAKGGGRHRKIYDPAGRNCRSVWSITTQPYRGAHFAVMPEDLAERCVLAGSRPGDLVLDPFIGSGTVARVAISLGRRAVGCDLNRGYLDLAEERTTVTRGLPLEMEASA